MHRPAKGSLLPGLHAGSAADREENLPYPVSMGGNGRFIQSGQEAFREKGQYVLEILERWVLL